MPPTVTVLVGTEENDVIEAVNLASEFVLMAVVDAATPGITDLVVSPVWVYMAYFGVVCVFSQKVFLFIVEVTNSLRLTVKVKLVMRVDVINVWFMGSLVELLSEEVFIIYPNQKVLLYLKSYFCKQIIVLS